MCSNTQGINWHHINGHHLRNLNLFDNKKLTVDESQEDRAQDEEIRKASLALGLKAEQKADESVNIGRKLKRLLDEHFMFTSASTQASRTTQGKLRATSKQLLSLMRLGSLKM